MILFCPIFCCVYAGETSRYKSRGDIISSRISMNVHDFAAKKQAWSFFGFHCFWFDFFYRDAPACDKCFFKRESAVYLKSKMLA